MKIKKMKKLILSASSSEMLMRELLKVKQEDSVILYIDNSTRYTIKEIIKISNLIKTLDCSIDTITISDLGVKEFLILILFCNQKRVISDGCIVTLNREPEVDAIGIKAVADLIANYEINYSKRKFIRDYENNVTYEFKKLKSIFNFSDNQSNKLVSSKQTTKKKHQAIPLSAVNNLKNIEKVVTTESDNEKPVSDDELSRINNVETKRLIKTGKKNK